MNSSMQHKLNLKIFARGRRLFLVVAAICFCAMQTAQAQTSYSDMWLNGAPSAMTGDDTVQPPVDELQTDTATLAGCGVTEGAYNDYNNYQSETKIISPSGIVAAASGPTGSWSEADVSLSVSLTSPEEGDYTVETKHTKYTYGGGTNPTQIAENPIGHHASKYKNMRSATNMVAPPFGIFSWITRLLGKVRTFKIVYEYANTQQIGTEMRYFYTIVCQKPFCQAQSAVSYPASKFGGLHPPFVVIRGVKVSVNLIFTTIHFCGGKTFAAYYRETC